MFIISKERPTRPRQEYIEINVHTVGSTLGITAKDCRVSDSGREHHAWNDEQECPNCGHKFGEEWCRLSTWLLNREVDDRLGNVFFLIPMSQSGTREEI